jgi:hypothetical protein
MRIIPLSRVTPLSALSHEFVPYRGVEDSTNPIPTIFLAYSSVLILFSFNGESIPARPVLRFVEHFIEVLKFTR